MCHGSPTNTPLDSSSCPFTIRRLNSTTYLVREHDCFGEFPHIYVKRCTETLSNGTTTTVLVVTDTGVGTSSSNSTSSGPSEWTIKSFLDHNFNPDVKFPYLVVLSHCHFDHILGLNSLLLGRDNNTTVLSSSHDPTFTSPYEKLEEHSLCADLSLSCPKYQSTGVKDHELVVYTHPIGVDMHLPIMTLHTPGHTPDSLSWFDTQERVLYVGDSFYAQVSENTKNAPRGPERPAPIIFPKEGNLFDWWNSVNKLLAFVKEKNGNGQNGEKRVKLCAGHVTAEVDATDCLVSVKRFMAEVLRDKVGFVEQPERRGEAFGHWTDDKDGQVGDFSVAAPLRIIEDGRKSIPEDEWRSA